MSTEFNAFMQQLKAAITPLAVDATIHVPTDGEINNLIYLSSRYIANFPARAVDIQMVQMMSGPIESMKDLDEKLIPELGSYIWDHLMGEPDDPSQEQVTAAAAIIKDILYGMPSDIRNDTEIKQ